MKLFITSLVAVGISFAACTKRESATSQADSVRTDSVKQNHDMKNLVSIVEIPTSDFERAKIFYQAVFSVDIEVVELEGIKIGLLPPADGSPALQIIHGDGNKPSSTGSLVYLSGGDNLQIIADRVVAHGGSMVLPKTEIAPGMGFYATFKDPEGNKVGLYSMN